MSGSRIAEIIDYTAVKAASITGVAAVAGMGAELYADPKRAGSQIAAATEWPAIPFTHQTIEPNAPEVQPTIQEGTVAVVWTIPMRLWLSKAPIDQIRRAALPFYSRYLACFAPDFRLGGLCQKSRIKRFAIANAPSADWAWLQVDLEVTEWLNFTDGGAM